MGIVRGKIAILGILVGWSGLILANQLPSAPESEERTSHKEAVEESSTEMKRMSEAQQSELKFATGMGRLLYEKDVMAARATDILMERKIFEKDKRLLGWVTDRRRDGWVVKFVGTVGDSLTALYEVVFADSRGEFQEQATDLTPSQKQMFTARQTAIEAIPIRCSGTYNSVVVPGDLLDSDGWAVYLLAATFDPNEVVIGGHYRITTDMSGETVLDVKPFTKSCLSVDRSDQDWIVFTHILSDTPTETHVFLSYLHGIIVHVITSTGVGIVAPDSIYLLNSSGDSERTGQGREE